MPEGERQSRPPLLLLGGFALFVVVTGYFVVSSVTKRSLPTFDPSPPARATAAASLAHDDTITVDASDPKAWRYVDFDRGGMVVPPDTAGWDVAIRRYVVIASDAIADVGRTPFELVADAPEDAYVANATTGDTVNAAIRRWYRYNMLTHLLEPAGHSYIVRTRERRFASLQVLGYYCTGMRPGCLTLRYTYPLARSWSERQAALNRQ